MKLLKQYAVERTMTKCITKEEQYSEGNNVQLPDIQFLPLLMKAATCI